MSKKAASENETQDEASRMTALVPVGQAALAVYGDQERVDELLARGIEAARACLPENPDMAVARDRDAVRHAAALVGTFFQRLDKARLTLTEEMRTSIATINSEGLRIKTRLREEQAAIRKPLSDWEAAEVARLAALERRAAALYPSLYDEPTTADIAAEIRRIQDIPIDDSWQEQTAAAGKIKDESLARLRKLWAAAEKREAEAAELARLRQAEADRIEAERRDAERREAFATMLDEAFDYRLPQGTVEEARAALNAVEVVDIDAWPMDDEFRTIAMDRKARSIEIYRGAIAAAEKRREEAEAKAAADRKRIADEAAAKARAEAAAAIQKAEDDRLAALRARWRATFMDGIAGKITDPAEGGRIYGHAVLSAEVARVFSIEIDDSWQEQRAAAGAKKVELLATLDAAIEVAFLREQEVEKARLRKEEEAQAQAAADALEAQRQREAADRRKDLEARTKAAANKARQARNRREIVAALEPLLSSGLGAIADALMDGQIPHVEYRA